MEGTTALPGARAPALKPARQRQAKRLAKLPDRQSAPVMPASARRIEAATVWAATVWAVQLRFVPMPADWSQSVGRPAAAAHWRWSRAPASGQLAEARR